MRGVRAIRRSLSPVSFAGRFLGLIPWSYFLLTSQVLSSLPPSPISIHRPNNLPHRLLHQRFILILLRQLLS